MRFSHGSGAKRCDSGDRWFDSANALPSPAMPSSHRFGIGIPSPHRIRGQGYKSIPHWGSGHFIPMADMAKLLAQHGVTITIITTPLVAARLIQIIQWSAASSLPVRLLHVPFPYMVSGLPEGSETMETIPSLDLMKNFYIAIEMLQQPFERLFEPGLPRSRIDSGGAGEPMIMWPMFTEQFFNEKLVVQALGTGVGVGA
ncbi:hypothetical protein Acr_08g0016870 [Actinidia rufa]|uniref:UDP-Glycosyltransferase superfamily protein n=1 Tax=Actinidia rufa TaxID=165716 RepID=A0A7J0F3M5_9ERIC|nr:hypothetical protein Acr_08g0016870 [Actinidia rufa]